MSYEANMPWNTFDHRPKHGPARLEKVRRQAKNLLCKTEDERKKKDSCNEAIPEKPEEVVYQSFGLLH